MRFGLLLVGDELLSGKRSDKHLPQVVATLNQRGHSLAWCRMVGDDAELLTATLREVFASGTATFSCGGIGATPDDCTRQSAAAALGRELLAHPEAVAEIEARYGPASYPQRIRMAEFPVGARNIPNPVNRVAGFSVEQVHFVPGFPNMAWPMIDWVLEHEYADAALRSLEAEYLLRCAGASEGELIALMEAVLAACPQVRLSCLPDTSRRQEIEFGLRGPAAAAAAAYAQLRQGLEARDLSLTDERVVHYGAG